MLNAALVMLYLSKSDQKVQALNNEISNQKEYLSVKEDMIKEETGWERFLMGLGTVLLVIAIIPCIVVPIVEPGGSVVPYTVLGIGISLMILSFVCYKVRCSKALAQLEFNKQHSIEPRIKELNEQIDKIIEDKKIFWDTYKNLLDFLPQKYQNTIAVGFILEAISNMRASTLSEAINLYESEMHYWEIKKILQDTAKMQNMYNQYLNYSLQNIEQNQQLIHRDLQDVKVMQFINAVK